MRNRALNHTGRDPSSDSRRNVLPGLARVINPTSRGSRARDPRLIPPRGYPKPDGCHCWLAQQCPRAHLLQTTRPTTLAPACTNLGATGYANVRRLLAVIAARSSTLTQP